VEPVAALSCVAADAVGNFAVAWADDRDGNGLYQINARGYNASGVQRIAELTVNTGADRQQFEPAVATDTAGHVVVAWEDDQNVRRNFDIYGRGFTASGSNRFNQFRVNTTATAR
jgi:hypothetical protein